MSEAVMSQTAAGYMYFIFGGVSLIISILLAVRAFISFKHRKMEYCDIGVGDVVMILLSFAMSYYAIQAGLSNIP